MKTNLLEFPVNALTLRHDEDLSRMRKEYDLQGMENYKDKLFCEWTRARIARQYTQDIEDAINNVETTIQEVKNLTHLVTIAEFDDGELGITAGHPQSLDSDGLKEVHHLFIRGEDYASLRSCALTSSKIREVLDKYIGEGEKI